MTLEFDHEKLLTGFFVEWEEFSFALWYRETEDDAIMIDNGNLPADWRYQFPWITKPDDYVLIVCAESMKRFAHHGLTTWEK